MAGILRRATKAAFPSRLLGGWRGRWPVSGIPYFYAFMKLGCFPYGLLCCDRDHSHLREIMSSCTYPTPIKRIVQWVTKAFRVLIKYFRERTARLANMSRLSECVQNDVQNLRSLESCTNRCYCCQQKKPELCAVKGDARSY